MFREWEWGLPEVRLENSPFPRPSPHPQALVEVFAKRPPTKERGCSEWIEIYSPKEGAIYLNKVQARGGSCLRAAAPADRRSARSLPPPLPFLCSTQRQGATTYEVPPDLQVAPDLMLSGLISYHRWAFCLCMADPLLTPALFSPDRRHHQHHAAARHCAQGRAAAQGLLVDAAQSRHGPAASRGGRQRSQRGPPSLAIPAAHTRTPHHYRSHFFPLGTPAQQERNGCICANRRSPPADAAGFVRHCSPITLCVFAP